MLQHIYKKSFEQLVVEKICVPLKMNDTRFERECGYAIYELNNFYVEVKFNGRVNEISKFTSFLNHTKLIPYLDKIDIPGLVKILNSSF